MSHNTQPITDSGRSLRGVRVIWHIAAMVAAALLLQLPLAATAGAGPRKARLSSDLTACLDSGSTCNLEVIVTGSVEKIDRIAARTGLTVTKQLSSGAVFTVSRDGLEALAQDLEVDAVSSNSQVRSNTVQTTVVTGADAAWSGAIESLGAVNGSGIGVAVIDSGIAGDHPVFANRVIANVDFTDPNGNGYDFYGHGTHVAGIIAARAFNNTKIYGTDSGMAPAAHLINLKVLDSNGLGKADAVIQAIDFAIQFKTSLGIRVINLSLGAAPTQSYKDDPICLAVERAVKAGIVVVASAGNYGQAPDGKQVYGSVTSPGISPYAITVGALRTQGTLDPSDDEVAPWSSKGPTAIDHIAVSYTHLTLPTILRV